MYVADPFRPTAAGSSAPAAPEIATPVVPAPAAEAGTQPWSATGWRVPDASRGSGPRRDDGLGRRTGRLIAGAFALAWILCPSIEPMPSGPMPDYPMWQLPIDLATVGSIVAAVVVLWRGGRSGPRLGLVAGAFMLLETALCPIAGHTTVGWWTWTQTGLSLFVLATSAVLMARRGAPG